MKQVYIIIFVIVIVVAAMFIGYKVYHNLQENTIPQSGDLCGGTGGNGEIVNLGNNTFTLKMNNGTNRLVHIAINAIIKITAGSSSTTESNLNDGDRVTLMGKPSSDGSFTASGIYVCK